MSPTRLLALTLLCKVMLLSPLAAAKVKASYLDILLIEGAGELRGQQYDAYRSPSGNDVFVGTQQLDRGALLAAGFGLRLVMATERGLRFSGEGSVQGGRLFGIDPALTTSTVTRGELLAGIGYQRDFGRLVLHASGIFGGDYSSLKITQPWLGAVSASGSSSAGTSSPALAFSDDLTLKRWGMRLGVQAGAHVQLTRMAALYGDVTFDYDGQWRSRIGIAIGQPRIR